MKITNSVYSIYAETRVINDLLKKKVDDLFHTTIDPKWFYFSRIKQPESFALKLETGRAIDDFFACTIVVQSHKEIKEAVKLIRKYFKISLQKPNVDKITHKDPEVFVFDDLRLYISLKKEPSLPSGPINNVQFEMQVKTFFQHAWAIATHDLIYKSDEINWTKKRIAYQVKAMLENAEVSILRAEKVKKIIGLPEESIKFNELNKIRDFIIKNWSSDKLPFDLNRLTENVSNLLRNFNIKINLLEDIIIKETSLGRGVLTQDLSPYLVIIQSIIYQNPGSIKTYLNSRMKNKIFFSKEIDFSSLGYTKEQLEKNDKIVFI